MGANSLQALGVTILFVAFVLLAVSFALGGSVVLTLLAVVGIAASVAVFLKAKPLEHLEQ
jgi:hypothetical protein